MATVQTTNDDNGFRVTGRMVLFALIGFFGLIAAANVVMIWLAVSTQTGTVVDSAYKAGTEFQSEIEAAQAQALRNWSVTADIVRAGPGATIDIVIRDASGAPISSLVVAARLTTPVDATADADVALREGEIGRYHGSVDALAPGNWTLIINAERNESRVYHSENRILLR